MTASHIVGSGRDLKSRIIASIVHDYRPAGSLDLYSMPLWELEALREELADLMAREIMRKERLKFFKKS